jgi:hypothetical protein
MRTDLQGTSVEQLCRELEGVESPSGPDTHGVVRSETIVAEVTAGLSTDDGFDFREELVKESLDELLIVLVAISDGSTHGKGLMGDLADVFGVRLSPGTVYPKLHDLEEEGILEMHELVRTKEYRLADSEAARDRVETALKQHFALGTVFNRTLEDF